MTHLYMTRIFLQNKALCFNSAICPRLIRHSSLLSLFLWIERYFSFCKWEISLPASLARSRTEPFPLSIICPRLFFLLLIPSLVRIAFTHVMPFPTCTVGWVTGESPLDACDRLYAASFLFLKSKNQGQRTDDETLSTCRRSCPVLLTRLTSWDSPWAIIFFSIVGNEL